MPDKVPTSSLESLMHQLRRMMIGLSGALSYFAVPVALHAQVAGGVELFGALDNSAPITRTLGGVSLSLGTPYVGIRGSGAIGQSTLTPQFAGTTSGPSDVVWSANADLLLGPMNAGLGEGFMPYTFVGLGLESAAQPTTFTDAIRTWGYGGGVQLGLGSLVSVNGEARFKRLAAPATFADSQFVRGVEYRVGIGFHFGGRRSRSSIYSRRTVDRPPSASRPSRIPPSRTSGSSWPVVSTTSASGAARRVVPTAEQYIGVPYRYGGTSPRSGFDCSGFVQYVYGQNGVDLPRTSRQMAGSGVAVSTRALAVGDLLLFQQAGQISHVAIYAGNGRFIHSSSSGHGVRYDDFNTRRGSSFADHLVAARRVSGDSRIFGSTFGNALTGGSVIAFDHLDPPDSAPPPTK
jgi:cell wall-associated NlpC family hydrolase